MDSEVKIDFTVKQEFESKVTILKSEEKASSVTSDYAEEDVTSTSNSVATNNIAEGFDALDSTQDVTPNNPTEPVTVFTEEYLRSCINNLQAKIDRLKVDFHDLEDSFFKSKEASTVELCRKRLTSIIVLIEKVSSWKANPGHLSTTMCRALDFTYRTLCGIKEKLSPLGFKAANAIIKTEGIIDYANNHIRNIVLTLSEIDENDCTVVCEIEYSNNENKIKPEVIDIFSSDSECEVSNDKIILKKEALVKLERLEDVQTSISQTKASTSLPNVNSSDTDDSIVKNNTDSSNEGSSDPSYHPSDSMTDDCLNYPVYSSCEKSQKSKKGHTVSLKRRRSKLIIDSDSSDESESTVCFEQNVVSRKEKEPRRRPRVSASNEQMLEKLRKTLTDTSDESDTDENKKKTPPVNVKSSNRIKSPNETETENKKKTPPETVKSSNRVKIPDKSDTEKKKKTPRVPVRFSNRIKIPSQICSNSHCKTDNSIGACSSSWDNVHRLPRNETPDPCERLSDEWDYSDDSESEITNLWQELNEFPKSQTTYTSKIQREHKIALLGIRRILRSLVNC